MVVCGREARRAKGMGSGALGLATYGDGGVAQGVQGRLLLGSQRWQLGGLGLSRAQGAPGRRAAAASVGVQCCSAGFESLVEPMFSATKLTGKSI
jgi:hypothetical protein